MIIKLFKIYFILVIISIILLLYQYNLYLNNNIISFDKVFNELCESDDFVKGLIISRFKINYNPKEFTELINSRLLKHGKDKNSIYRKKFNNLNKKIEYSNIIQAKYIDEDLDFNDKSLKKYNYHSEIFKMNIYKNNYIELTVRHDLATGMTITKIYSELFLDKEFKYEFNYENFLKINFNLINPFNILIFLYFNYKLFTKNKLNLSKDYNETEKQQFLSKTIQKNYINKLSNSSINQTIISKIIYLYNKNLKNKKKYVKVGFVIYLGNEFIISNNCSYFTIKFYKNELNDIQKINDKINKYKKSFINKLKIYNSHYFSFHFNDFRKYFNNELDLFISSVPLSFVNDNSIISNIESQIYLRKVRYKLFVIIAGYNNKYDVSLNYFSSNLNNNFKNDIGKL